MTALSDAPARAARVRGPARRSPVLIAVAIIVGAAGLFFYFSTRSDLWLDEALSVNIARLPLSDLRGALRHDGAPPLFYVLLHIWTGVFGAGDVAARSLSGVCMIGAVVATWFVARRVGGSRVAWLSTLVMLTNPFAFRYATEARMYALVMLLVACGTLAFQRTVESPTAGRAAVFGVIVALAVYTQYWAFYLLVVVVGLLLVMIRRHRHRRAAVRLLIATAIGLVAFLPWVPTFLYQRAHTGTPWGTASLPAVPLMYTLRDFAGGASATSIDIQEGALLFLLMTTLLLLGVFGRVVDRRRVELDVRAQPEIRVLAVVAGLGLAVALSLNYLAGGAFQSRYGAIVFPLYVIIVARGLTVLPDARILWAAVACLIVLGFVGGVRNVTTRRTQAGEVAAKLHQLAHPGDVVAYCPDQVGPGVHRLAPRGLDEVVYPSLARPEFIDWVDYKQRLAAASPAAFARSVLARAGAHTIWYVSAPGYSTHVGTCEAIADAFAAARPRVVLTTPDEKILEKPALQQFAERTPGA